MPIISPWLFYLIEVLKNIKGCIEVVFWIGGSALAVLLLMAIDDSDDDSDIFDLIKKHLKKILFTIVLFILSYFLIPSSETMYKMLVSNYVTYENVDKATNAIKDGVDYIFEKIDGKESK